MKDRIKTLLTYEPSDTIISTEGWVRTKRDSKNVCFLELNDGSTLKGLQIVVNKDNFNNCDILSDIATGTAIKCEGKLVSSQGGNQAIELDCSSITIVGLCPSDYPLQKKRHTIEYLREIAHLRARTNLIGAAMRVRNTLAYAVHSFFQENGFVYVNTPLITGSDCEGAGQMFQVTTLDLNNPPKTEEGEIDYAKDFFGKKTSLTVSGQLEGETYAMALKNIYTFGPTFRAENSLTSRHLAEFWMIEPEMAFCDINLNMEVAESFLKYIFQAVLDKNGEDLAFFDQFVQKGLIETLKHVIASPFVHITYTKAVEILSPHNSEFEYPIEWGAELQTEHEKYLTEVVYNSPVIVTDYPKGVKAFYMKLNEDNETVRGMDVLVPRLGEIIGGSEREADLDKLLSRMKEMKLEEKDYSWYLDLRRYGSAPHAGFGLGFERVVQYVTGISNIRDVIPYPRYVKSAEF
ncbi:MAG: asparagine--tRNA ligase [Spirochaetales bacterium]|nr:asparagine--tRNA ligase [Spirochaetales bacterium]